ncbi:MAG TPA: hypothetical protein ENI23_09770 [bacterium]|nr:hypothetical protein [bacterium]
MIIEQRIVEEDWDNLIILDACRFDFFEKVYKDYLDGTLEKRISKGSNTGEWLVKTFPDKYDYVYISANPYINSRGIPLNKCRLEYKNYSWNAVEHFSKIIDVWDFGWSKEIKTVHPRNVNIAYLSNIYKKKTIIHYMQPHYPYISYKKETFEVKGHKYLTKIMKKNYAILRKNAPLITQKITNLLRQPNTLKRICKKEGMEQLLYYYEENLRIVLKHISRIINDLDGKTIITADHGEAFGEQGIWQHPPETYIPVLIEVPWLEVEG